MNIQFISHLISNIGCSAIIAFFFIKIDKANIIIKSKAKSKNSLNCNFCKFYFKLDFYQNTLSLLSFTCNRSLMDFNLVFKR